MKRKHADQKREQERRQEEQKREQEFQMTLVLMGVEIESLRERLGKREVTMDEMRKSILDPIRRI